MHSAVTPARFALTEREPRERQRPQNDRTMSVTLPDGRTQELTAPESGLATVSLKDGTEYGFRPTIQDSTPWNRIVVTIFRTATTNAPTQILGEVELKRGGPAVDSKTNPSFKVAVPKVSPPATPDKFDKLVRFVFLHRSHVITVSSLLTQQEDQTC